MYDYFYRHSQRLMSVFRHSYRLMSVFVPHDVVIHETYVPHESLDIVILRLMSHKDSCPTWVFRHSHLNLWDIQCLTDLFCGKWHSHLNLWDIQCRTGPLTRRCPTWHSHINCLAPVRYWMSHKLRWLCHFPQKRPVRYWMTHKLTTTDDLWDIECLTSWDDYVSSVVVPHDIVTWMSRKVIWMSLIGLFCEKWSHPSLSHMT